MCGYVHLSVDRNYLMWVVGPELGSSARGADWEQLPGLFKVCPQGLASSSSMPASPLTSLPTHPAPP